MADRPISTPDPTPDPPFGYRPTADRDEAFDAAGGGRPAWRPLLDSLAHIGLPDLARRWTHARALIRENGVTYNVYGDPLGQERPWQLDPLPAVLDAAEADTVRRGLTQRAALLDRLLHDLHGPQRTVAEGLIPADLVYGNPAFLRACHGVPPPGGRHLHLYGANVGRAADGGFVVLGDRTQAPTGTGYALENRIVISRTLPEPFRDCRVLRLARFFGTFRDTLRSLAPHNRDNPRVVVLTPGPLNETYFEHAYLARYLGFPLVEGADLTVRDGRVFLKVLDGLQPVDVIYRRLDDDFCDPLELRPDSFLGVPGLVDAVRSGGVAVSNALGAGLLETAALLAFLPALSQRLLGEPLRLPSVPTWWCGDPAARSHVLARLAELVVKPAVPTAGPEPAFGGELSTRERAALADRIRANPRGFIAQERAALSTAPAVVGDRLEPRRIVFRFYLAAEGADGYAFMPGGLARVAASADTLVASMQRGGNSKDTWILSDAPVDPFSLLAPTGAAVQLTRGGNDLPSRVADNLFWLGRYAERADGLARLLRAVLVRLTERAGLTDVPELPTLLRTTSALTDCLPGFVGAGADERLAAPADELRAVIHDDERPGSLATVLAALGRTARSVRDRVSTDMWRVLLDLTADPPPARSLSGELGRLEGLVTKLAAFGGLVMESVTRGYGWRFLGIGRKLERALHTAGLLRETLATPPADEPAVLDALLELADSSITYRRRYQVGLVPAAVLDLLVADDTNPRSLAFQLVTLADDVDHLPADPYSPRGRAVELARGCLDAVRAADPLALAEVGLGGTRTQLDDLLGRVAASLPLLSDALTDLYLSHLQPSRQLATFAGGDG